jgi:hypothetical protein
VLDLGCNGAESVGYNLTAGTVQRGVRDASSFGLESGLVSAVLGGTYRDTDQEHWRHGGVEWGERL